jgi:hypothetical protein
MESIVHLAQFHQFELERLHPALVHGFDLWNDAVGPEHDQ